jgi:protein-S-isoprenylcysteine O-methyltransferase Ste14
MRGLTAVANGVIGFWLVLEIGQILRSRRAGGHVQDAGTFRGMWGTAVVALVVGDAFRALVRHGPAWLEVPFGLRVLGLALIVAGVGFRWYAMRYLGRYFTVRVTIQPDQRLVDQGPYRRLRHPSYTGAWAGFLGLGLVTGNWPAVVVWGLLPLSALLRRIRVEESALENHFGEAYAAYRRRTWRLIPWVY